MPNTHSTLTSLFTDIANAIRAKKGTSADIVADNFPSEITNIPSGAITIPQFEKFEVYTYIPISDIPIGLGESGLNLPASIPHSLGVVPDFVYGVNIGNNMDDYVSGQYRVRQFGRLISPSGDALDVGYQRETAWSSKTALHNYKDGRCNPFIDHIEVGQAPSFGHTFYSGDVFIVMVGKWVSA